VPSFTLQRSPRPPARAREHINKASFALHGYSQASLPGRHLKPAAGRILPAYSRSASERRHTARVPFLPTRFGAQVAELLTHFEEGGPMNERGNLAPCTRQRQGSIAYRAVAIGSIASLAVHGVLAIFGRSAGRSAFAPVNATSHIVYGPAAGAVDEADLPHTGVGAAINHGASIFWAVPLAWWLATRRETSTADIVLGAAATGIAAGVVDYGVVPRRLSPGWHLALPARSVAGTFGALAVGLALGALLTRGPSTIPPRRTRGNVFGQKRP